MRDNYCYNAGDYGLHKKEDSMKIKLFRQRLSQIQAGETEINDWLEEVAGKIEISFVQQSAYTTENTERGTAGYIISVWYTET